MGWGGKVTIESKDMCVYMISFTNFLEKSPTLQGQSVTFNKE